LKELAYHIDLVKIRISRTPRYPCMKMIYNVI